MRAFPLALGVWMAATAAVAEQASPPRPLPGNAVQYPEQARLAGVVGEVLFTAEVDESGAVTGVTIRSVPFTGYGFEDGVTTAVRGWRFTPGTAEGRRVRGTYEGRVNFQLRPQDEPALRALAARAAALWNVRDAAGMAALFDPEHAVVRPQQGEAVKGPKPVAEWVQGRLAGTQERLSEKPGGIRFIAADAAFVLIPLEGAAAAAPPPDAAATTWAVLAVKRGDTWRIARFDAGASDPEPLRIGGQIREPKKVKHVNPNYPDDAKNARVQGVVILECVVDPEGRVRDVKVLRGVPMLDGPAIDAVRQWVYTPTYFNGVAVPVIMTVTVNFRLR
jgi:TonB family protein